MKLWEIRTVRKGSMNPTGEFIVCAEDVQSAIHAVATFGDAGQYIDPLSGHWGIDRETGRPRVGTGVIASTAIPDDDSRVIVYAVAVMPTVSAETITWAESLIA